LHIVLPARAGGANCKCVRLRASSGGGVLRLARRLPRCRGIRVSHVRNGEPRPADGHRLLAADALHNDADLLLRAKRRQVITLALRICWRGGCSTVCAPASRACCPRSAPSACSISSCSFPGRSPSTHGAGTPAWSSSRCDILSVIALQPRGHIAFATTPRSCLGPLH
jgi:hypothetical protein